MERKQARRLADAIQSYHESAAPGYRCIDNNYRPSRSSHSRHIADFTFERDDGAILRIEISVWRANKPSTWYLVLSRKKSAPLAEMTLVRDDSSNERVDMTVEWTYRAQKKGIQSSRNTSRDQAFAEANAGSRVVRLDVPHDDASMISFLEQAYHCLETRETAEAAALTDEFEASREGKRVLAIHYKRERHSASAAKAKRRHAARHYPRLPCQGCDMDFRERYGERGLGYIEAHHKTPLSELGKDETVDTRPKDYDLLCANCHRIVHRGMTLLTLEELREIIRPLS